jgi:hypothetical protein
MQKFVRLLAVCTLYLSTSAFAEPTPIVAWGDSITRQALVESQTFPLQLGKLLGRQAWNRGIGGQRSYEIAARQGGAPALVSFPSNLIPPRNNVLDKAGADSVMTKSVSVFPITSQGPATLHGTINEVHGAVWRGQDKNGVPQLVFKRDGGIAPVVVDPQTPFHPDTYGTEGWINIFWLGRLNLSELGRVASDTQKCIASLTTDHYIVLSVLTGASEGNGTATHYNTVALNNYLSQMFPARYLDVRAALIKAYDPANLQDVADYAADTVPSSLRSDAIHLNEKGHAVVAKAAADFITTHGW